MVATRTGLLVVAAATVTATLLTTPAHAKEAGDAADVDCEPSPAELDDIEFMAEQEGISRDEAIARHGWQQCFSEATDHLRDAHPEQYAGAAIVDDGRGAWIAFRGEAPDEAEELADAIPVAVELVEGRGFSEAELDETLQAVYDDVRGHGEVADAAGGYDLETGVITIEAQPRDTVTDPAEREQLQQALQPEQPADAAVTVQVNLVESLDAHADEQAADPDGDLWSPRGYAALLAVVLLTLVAGLVTIRKARR